MFDIVTIGEALIDLAAVDAGLPLSDVTAFKKVAGGAPANVAVGCSKLGKKTGFITRVGNEAFGRHIKDTLKKYGVDISGIQNGQRSKHRPCFFRHAHSVYEGIPFLPKPRGGHADTV